MARICKFLCERFRQFDKPVVLELDPITRRDASSRIGGHTERRPTWSITREGSSALRWTPWKGGREQAVPLENESQERVTSPEEGAASSCCRAKSLV